MLRQLSRRYFTTRTNRKKIQLAVFDVGGTIIDAGCKAPAITFKKVFDQYKFDTNMSNIRKHMGICKKEHIRRLLLDGNRDRINEDYDYNELSKLIDRMYYSFEEHEYIALEEYGKPITGTIEVLSRLGNESISVGLCTGFNRNILNKILQLNPVINQLITTCVANNEVSLGRPSPFMVYQNMMNTRVTDYECVVKVDDTVSGILEGVNAGCWTIGVSKYGNSMGMDEEEIIKLKKIDPEEYHRRHNKAILELKQAGANMVVDEIRSVPQAINKINDLLFYGHDTTLKMWLNTFYLFINV